MKQLLEDCAIEGVARSRAVEALLLELVDALRARGALDRGDIAGAFFRAEDVLRAHMKDDDTAGVIDPPRHLAMMEQYWTKRMTFHPDLFALRKRVRAWEEAGAKEPHPAHALEIRRAYDETDE